MRLSKSIFVDHSPYSDIAITMKALSVTAVKVLMATTAMTTSLAFHPSSLSLTQRTLSPRTSDNTPFNPTYTATKTTLLSFQRATRLYASSSSTNSVVVPETLATEGDWSAYLDEESTGLVYYFNGKTGESKWEPPTSTFPVVILPRSVRRKAEAKRMAYIKAVEEQQQRNANAAAVSSSSSSTSSSSSGGSSIFSNLMDNLTGGDSSSTTTTNKDDAMVSKKKQERWFDFLFDFDTKPAEKNEIEKQASLQQEREKSWLDSFLFPDKQEEEEAQQQAKDKKKKQEQRGWFGSFFSSKVNGDSSASSSKSKSSTATKSRESVQQVNVPAREEEPEKPGNSFFDNFLSPGGGSGGSDSGGATLEPVVSESESSAVAEQQQQIEAPAEKTTTTTTTTTTLPAPEVAKKEKKEEITKETPEFQPIEIDMASYVMPHPQKIFWGGEDAVFIRGRTFGVFDGVSGASKLDGVPLYSKTLASEMKKIVYQINPKSVNTDDDDGLNVRQLTDSLTTARTVADQTSTGASTAIVGSITADGYLRVLNLGDSACLVIRNGKVVGKTREISHYFDCPYQLSTESPDIPRDGTKMNMELVRGDIIVMGSDGIFDNLYPEDIVEIVANSPIYTSNNGDSSNGYNAITKQNRKRWLPALAKTISDKSRKISLNKRVPTPYAEQSKKNGDPEFADGLGGKLDDISCIVVRYS